MDNFKLIYVPAGVGTFHMGIAGERFEASRALVAEICDSAKIPDGILLSSDAVADFVQNEHPDAVIFQNITFANAAFISEVLRLTHCPIILWALKEPRVEGGRLCLNSLTGAYSASNAVTAFRGKAPGFVLGDPDEDSTKAVLQSFIAAARVKKAMKSLKILSVGQTPQGFGFGQATDMDLLKGFGIRLETVEARALINNALRLEDKDFAAESAASAAAMRDFDKLPEINQLNHARLLKAYSDYIKANNIGAIASRCWPDFFTDFGTPVCAVLSMLADMGTAVACEADLTGALSVWIGMQLSSAPAFFGDPSSMDDDENSITFWHCGMAPCSMARKPEGAAAGLHPNRKLGPAMDFGCGAIEGVTVFRCDRRQDGSFVFFSAEGTVPDTPKRFIGASVTVVTDKPVREVISAGIDNGLSPHYAVIQKRCTGELKALAKMLGVDYIEA